MSTIFILTGSLLGFMLAMASLALGAGLPFALLLWTGSGLIAALVSVAMATPVTKDETCVAQSA
jgi:hypothetical protein